MSGELKQDFERKNGASNREALTHHSDPRRRGRGRSSGSLHGSTYHQKKQGKKVSKGEMGPSTMDEDSELNARLSTMVKEVASELGAPIIVHQYRNEGGKMMKAGKRTYQPKSSESNASDVRNWAQESSVEVKGSAKLDEIKKAIRNAKPRRYLDSSDGSEVFDLQTGHKARLNPMMDYKDGHLTGGDSVWAECTYASIADTLAEKTSLPAVDGIEIVRYGGIAYLVRASSKARIALDGAIHRDRFKRFLGSSKRDDNIYRLEGIIRGLSEDWAFTLPIFEGERDIKTDELSALGLLTRLFALSGEGVITSSASDTAIYLAMVDGQLVASLKKPEVPGVLADGGAGISRIVT